MTDLTALADFYRRYGQASFAIDEPVYAEICDAIASNDALLELLAAHPRDAQQPNLILAAVHYLLLGGLDHPLAQIYAGTSDADAATCFVDLVLANREAIDELLRTRRTQTNEVGRSAVIALLLHDAQQRAGQPLSWIDLGTSGGLNLQADRSRITYELADSTASTGPGDSPLALRCEVREGEPDIRSRHADIAWRVGIDRAPIDISNPAEARWLEACLWPSNTTRLLRMKRAIELAQLDAPRIIEATASAGVAQALAEAPADTQVVITTTWVWYYLPAESREQVLDTIRSTGRHVLWYSIEGAGVVDALGVPKDRHAVESVIGLVELEGSEPAQAHVLGVTHPHGEWIRWHSR